MGFMAVIAILSSLSNQPTQSNATSQVVTVAQLDAKVGHGRVFVCESKPAPGAVAARCEWVSKGGEPRGF